MVIYSLADAVVAVSSGVADSLAETTGFSRSKITVIRNPVRNLNNTLLSEEDASTLQSWLSAKHRLIAIGSLKRQKGFDNLIEALAILQEQGHKDVSLLILGEGDLRNKLNDLCQLRGVSHLVFMPGFRDNPAPFLSVASIFVLSSDWEGFGNVIVEALSLGIPVVSTDCPSGPSEILCCGKYGRLVPPRNPAAMAEAIRESLSAPPNSNALIIRSNDFRASVAAAQYLDLLSGNKNV